MSMGWKKRETGRFASVDSAVVISSADMQGIPTTRHGYGITMAESRLKRVLFWSMVMCKGGQKKMQLPGRPKRRRGRPKRRYLDGLREDMNVAGVITVKDASDN